MSDSENKTKGFNLDMWRTDPEKATKGVWKNLMQGTRFLVAQAGNTAAAAYRNQLIQENMYAVQQQKADALMDIHLRVMARHILLDWENLHDLDEDGNEVEVVYSEETAYNKLKELPKLADTIQAWSDDIASFKNTAKEDLAKN